MLRICAVALFAIAMSVGLAQAKGHKHKIAACSEGTPVAATCTCGWKKRCARTGNGATASSIPARGKSTISTAQAANLSLRPSHTMIHPDGSPTRLV